MNSCCFCWITSGYLLCSITWLCSFFLAIIVCGVLEIQFRSKPIKNRAKPLKFERKTRFKTQTRVWPGSGPRVDPPEVEDEVLHLQTKPTLTQREWRSVWPLCRSELDSIFCVDLEIKFLIFLYTFHNFFRYVNIFHKIFYNNMFIWTLLWYL